MTARARTVTALLAATLGTAILAGCSPYSEQQAHYAQQHQALTGESQQVLELATTGLLTEIGDAIDEARTSSSGSVTWVVRSDESTVEGVFDGSTNTSTITYSTGDKTYTERCTTQVDNTVQDCVARKGGRGRWRPTGGPSSRTGLAGYNPGVLSSWHGALFESFVDVRDGFPTQPNSPNLPHYLTGQDVTFGANGDISGSFTVVRLAPPKMPFGEPKPTEVTYTLARSVAGGCTEWRFGSSWPSRLFVSLCIAD